MISLKINLANHSRGLASLKRRNDGDGTKLPGSAQENLAKKPEGTET
jgi:hypothetical protein